MNVRWLFVVLLIIAMFTNIAVAESQYGKINVYYNDKHLPGTEVAKPTLKIGEPFSVAAEMTMYQDCKVYIELSDLGTNLGSDYFVFIDGPSDLGESYDKIFTKNETYVFEWTLKPTDEWSGGAMPINFHYEIFVKGEYDPLVNSEFTIAVPYITTEYYEGDTTPTTTTYLESPTSTDDPTTPSTPAFTFLVAVLAIVVAARKR